MDEQIKNQLQAVQDNAQNYGGTPDVQADSMPGMTVAAPIPRPIPPSAENLKSMGMKKGGRVKKMAKGGSVTSASKRADGCAVKGKTKGRIV